VSVVSNARHDSLDGVNDPDAADVLFGHEGIMAAILDQHASGRLHHALALSGPPGIGKATLAFLVARQLFEREGDADAGAKIRAGSHSALLHLTRGWNEDTKKFRQDITVDDIRRVGRFLGSTAATGGTRVVIIDNADDMNRNAANALLKNLEEPPAKVHYFLIVQQASNLLATIRSRCRMVHMQSLQPEALQHALAQAGLDADEAANIVPLAEGSVRRGLIMAREGGLDIAQALDALLASRPANTAEINALAGVGAVATEARSGQKQPQRAAKLAELHADLQARRATGEAYNLDRWLEIHNALVRTHALLARQA
jgi:DNA polymerase III subunit delta'